MSNKKTTKFDIAEYLEDDETMAEYLNVVLEEGESADILSAIGHIANTQGMSKIAAQTGLSRTESLQSSFKGS